MLARPSSGGAVVFSPRLGTEQGAPSPARTRLGTIRLAAGSLQPARPRGGARDVAIVCRRRDRDDRASRCQRHRPCELVAHWVAQAAYRWMAPPRCLLSARHSPRWILQSDGAQGPRHQPSTRRRHCRAWHSSRDSARGPARRIRSSASARARCGACRSSATVRPKPPCPVGPMPTRATMVESEASSVRPRATPSSAD